LEFELAASKRMLLHGGEDACADEDIRRSINKFSGEVEAVQIKRNRAVHDAWQAGLSSKRVYQLRVAVKGNKLLFESEQISVRG
jgi:hypothetical protein